MLLGKTRIPFVSCSRGLRLGVKPALKKGEISASPAPEQRNQESAKTMIRLVGRLHGPLVSDNFQSGFQARIGPVKGVR